MLRILIIVVLFIPILFGVTAQGQNSRRIASSPYLFIWAGDDDRKQSDFLAVIDVRPNSKRYGQIVTTLPIGVSNTVPHHTEHEMPAGGILFANGFGAGQTFRFDLSSPTKPHLLDVWRGGRIYAPAQFCSSSERQCSRYFSNARS